MQRYIIVGNGVAGVEAAINIRNLDNEGDILIISPSKKYFYARPRLIDYLSGKVDLGKITANKEEFYFDKDIAHELGARVVEINPEKHLVVTDDGQSCEYDKLLLATGARAFMPEIPGNEKKGAFTFRAATDADNIREYCTDLESVVLIGGGLLGLETAYSLTLLGKTVTVVEFADHLLPNQLDTAAGALLQQLLEEKGINFILKCSAEEILGGEHVEGIKLNNGTTIDCGAVVFSTGVRSRLELAYSLGLETNRGIVVDDHMVTSLPDIYAAGDVAEHRGRCYGLWQPSKQQGAVAGQNMAGEEILYDGSPVETRLKVAGISLFSAGAFEAEGDNVIIEKENGVYRKLVFLNEKLIGANIIGDNKAAMTCSKVYEGKRPVRELSNIISKPID